MLESGFKTAFAKPKSINPLYYTMHLQLIPEYLLQPTDKEQIAALVQRTFADTDYGGRTYFKQLPHYRLLAKDGDMLLGLLSIDYRVMNMAGKPIQVMGVADLCVDEAQRGKGYGKLLMQRLEEIAREVPGNVDFLFLVTDIPAFYQALGYQSIPLTVSWLKLYQHKNYGVGKERINDACFMIKQIGDIAWQGEELDMLGYMY